MSIKNEALELLAKDHLGNHFTTVTDVDLTNRCVSLKVDEKYIPKDGSTFHHFGVPTEVTFDWDFDKYPVEVGSKVILSRSESGYATVTTTIRHLKDV